MISTVLQVALGGALGAAARYLVGVAVLRAAGPGVPLAILTVNIVGAFLMGLFVVAAAQKGLGHWGPFVMVGVLGGFTTFSAFSLEAYTLYERGLAGQAAAYVMISVACSIAGLIAGVWLGRTVWA